MVVHGGLSLIDEWYAGCETRMQAQPFDSGPPKFNLPK